MKAQDLRDKTPDQLREELASLKKEAFNLRFQQSDFSEQFAYWGFFHWVNISHVFHRLCICLSASSHS